MSGLDTQQLQPGTDGWGLCSQNLLRNNQQGHLKLLWTLPLYGWELPRPELASRLFKAERAAEVLGRKIVFIGVAWHNTRFSVFSDLENQALPVHFSSPRVTPKARPTVAPLVDVLYKANAAGSLVCWLQLVLPRSPGLLNVRISTLSSLHVYWRESRKSNISQATGAAEQSLGTKNITNLSLEPGSGGTCL